MTGLRRWWRRRRFGFTPADVTALLRVVLGDPKEISAAASAWTDCHLKSERDAAMLMSILAELTADEIGVQAGGHFVGVQVSAMDGDDAPWAPQIAGQLIACSINGDKDTTLAVVKSVIDQGEKPTSEAISCQLGVFRSVVMAKKGWTS